MLGPVRIKRLEGDRLFPTFLTHYHLYPRPEEALRYSLLEEVLRYSLPEEVPRFRFAAQEAGQVPSCQEQSQVGRACWTDQVRESRRYRSLPGRDRPVRQCSGTHPGGPRSQQVGRHSLHRKVRHLRGQTPCRRCHHSQQLEKRTRVKSPLRIAALRRARRHYQPGRHPGCRR